MGILKAEQSYWPQGNLFKLSYEKQNIKFRMPFQFLWDRRFDFSKLHLLKFRSIRLNTMAMVIRSRLPVHCPRSLTDPQFFFLWGGGEHAVRSVCGAQDGAGLTTAVLVSTVPAIVHAITVKGSG